MRYMKWTPYFEPGENFASLEIFDRIRLSGGSVDALHTNTSGDMLCIISDDVDINALDPKWNAVEITSEEVLEALRLRDPRVFLRPDGTPLYPSEILQNEIPTLPIEYI